MEKIDMKKVLLHGIDVQHPGYNHFNASLMLLNSILQSGYIMNRKTLREFLNKSDNRELYNIAFIGKCDHYGGDEVISLGCLDIPSFEKHVIEKNGNNFSCEFSSGIYLIINPIILDKMEIIKDDNRKGIIPGEIQVIGNISIEYIMAININSQINMILRNVANYLFNNKGINRQAIVLIREWMSVYDGSEKECLKLITEKCNESNSRSNQINDLLKEINCDIPIVDDEGEEISINDQIEKGYSLMKSYKENWNKRNNR